MTLEFSGKNCFTSGNYQKTPGEKNFIEAIFYLLKKKYNVNCTWHKKCDLIKFCYLICRNSLKYSRFFSSFHSKFKVFCLNCQVQGFSTIPGNTDCMEFITIRKIFLEGISWFSVIFIKFHFFLKTLNRASIKLSSNCLKSTQCVFALVNPN